jgi:sialate O-acetylesterase
MKQSITLILLIAVLAHIGYCANNFISNALGSHMVLQRAPQRANIWGWTTAGASVSVRFNSKLYQVTAAASGLWSVLLDATPAGGPYTINVASTSGATATLEDVLFGDVYVCGGQSNMQFTVHSAFNATYEIAAANNYPRIRLFTVGQGTTSAVPLDEFSTISQQWSVASAATVGVGDWNEFSAACWFFGRDLYDNLQVPIGLFSDNWGGTIVQAWSSPDALKQCPASGVVEYVGGPNDPSNLWNAMIVPILPMTITGAIWYQGESNSGQPNYYACGFPEMIKDWRLKWGGDTSKEFTFYFVQLSTWRNGDLNAEALTRLSQTYALRLPKVGLATAIDSGDPTSPFGDIHPRYKQVVGYRLHLSARAIGYGQNVVYRGPEATKWTVVSQAPSASVLVDFDPASIGSGLVLTPKACDAGITIEQCAWADIGSSDGKWTNATVTLGSSSVTLTASLPSGVTVTGVRYAWANYPVAIIYNKEGLPALPFAFPNPIVPTR